MRTTSAAMSGWVVGRPGRRVFVVLRGAEFAVPAQDRVGCHDARDSREVPTAEDVAFHGETASLVVGEANPSRTVRRTEDPVFLAQVVNHGLLLSIDPA
jgi:hypothetical protein